MKSMSFLVLAALIALSAACGATDDGVDYADNNDSAADNAEGDRVHTGTGDDRRDSDGDTEVVVDEPDHGENNDEPKPDPSCGASGAACGEGSACAEEINCPPCVEEDPPCNAACSVEYVCVPEDQDAGSNNSVGIMDIAICEGNEESDAFDLRSMSFEEDVLTYGVAYGGGCEDHDFTLCWDGTFLESFPVQVNLRLIHNAHNDACEAYLSEEVSFSLVSLREAYQDGYGDTGGTIFVNTEGEDFPYEF